MKYLFKTLVIACILTLSFQSSAQTESGKPEVINDTDTTKSTKIKTKLLDPIFDLNLYPLNSW